jgi:hypothetical protein
MKRTIPHIITALVFLTAGYIAGSFRSTRQAAIGSNANSLIWLTGIHEMISKGDHKRAKEITESAVDAHVAVLAQVQRDPAATLVWMIPWTPDIVGQVTPNALKRANDYFVGRTDVLKPETREFLTATQQSK